MIEEEHKDLYNKRLLVNTSDLGSNMNSVNDKPTFTKSEKVEKLMGGVNEVIRTHAAESMKKKDKGSSEDKIVPYSQILLTYATSQDTFILIFGTINAIIGGAAVPSLTFLMGNLITGVGKSEYQVIKNNAAIMFYIGIGVFFVCWGYVTTLTMYSQRITRKTRVEYLRAILKQDTKWFDMINVQELSSKMSKDISAVERAIGEKAGFIIFGIARSIAGFVFAFAKGWLLSIILVIGFPVIGSVSLILFKALQSGYDAYL